jgi:hypothetical protein
MIELPDGCLSAPTSMKVILDKLAFASTASDVVDAVRKLNMIEKLPWVMEYECISPLQTEANKPKAAELERQQNSKRTTRRNFTSKTLLCALSQCISGAAAVDPMDALVTYYILETTSGLYFGSSAKSQGASDSNMNSDSDTMEADWKRRPFIFSSSLNLEIAESVCKTLKAKVLKNRREAFAEDKCEQVTRESPHEGVKEEKRINDAVTLMDPCCGSGTTLFMARRYV